MQATRAGPRRALWWAVGLAGLAAIAVGLVALDRRVVAGFRDERWRHPVRVYGAPTVLRLGIDVERAGLASELIERGYRETSGPASEPGTFRRTGTSLEVFVRAAPRPGLSEPDPPRRIRLGLDAGRIREIVAVDSGAHVAEATLDAPLLEGLFREHWVPRRPLLLDRVPPRVVAAVLLAEDARFWEHPGVDAGALLRALRINWEAGELRQGGSTITQQLVKNTYLTPERTLSRKLVEIPMALSLEWHFSKRAILEAYLATVYLGHDRLIGVYGLAEAAAVYLGKDVSELTLGEGALLGGMIRAPNVYSPLRHPDRALARRDQVIAHLERLHRIGPEEAEQARAESLPVPAVRAAAPESFFLQHVRRELGAALDVAQLRPGSSIFTTLDPRLQGIVVEEVRAWDPDDAGPEVAIVALDPRSGGIRAMVGSRDYLKSQLDRATRAHRALGPMVEPLLQLAVFAEPPSPRPAARTRQVTGEELAALTARMSLTPPPDGAGAVAAGELTASLLELVAAYGILPAGGRRPAPFAVTAVEAASGEILLDGRRAPVPAADASASRSVHSRLVRTWADRRLAPARASAAPAGATGTTEGRRDAWIVGYAPDLVLGVWTGFDDERALEPGAEARVASLWKAIFARARAGHPDEEVATSPGLELVGWGRPGAFAPGRDLLAQGSSR